MASPPAVCCSLALCAGMLGAQTPGSQLVVLLRDPSGQAVAGALGTLRCSPEHELVAVPDQAAAATLASGRSDARGMLRFQTAGAARAGAGLVATDAGLGALLPRLRPGEAQRVALRPLAEVTTATGSEPFVLWARAQTVEHGAVTLPVARGTRVLLPAGSYEVWAASEDGWTWQRLDLVSGRRSVLQFTGPAQRLRSRDGVRIHPTGWPELTLCEPGGECVLRGAALAAALTAVGLDDGVLVADRTLPMPPTRSPLAWPPVDAAAAQRQFTFAAGAAGAALFCLQRTASGGWQLLAGDRVDADGRASLPEPGSGDTWLLLVAPDHAPAGRPWSLTSRGSDLALVRGVPLQVTATAPDGNPAVDLLVEYVPTGAEVAAVRARSDGRGVARLGPVAGPGTLLVSDARYANQQVELAQVPIDGLPITLDAGGVLHGRLRFADGTAAAGAVVTLRDPGGRLRPAERAAVAGDDGAFSFPGLPDDRGLVVFATTMRDGRTWSAKRSRLVAGDDTEPDAAIELVLRDEDPQLRPR